jgi:hypothetical protein
MMKRLVVAFVTVLVPATWPAVARAQSETPPGSLFTRVELLTHSNGTVATNRRVAVWRDDMLLLAPFGSPENTVEVFERDPAGDHWAESAALVPSDGTPLFGRTVATDATTIAIGADRAVFVYERGLDQTWREVAKLTGDPDDELFEAPVLVNETTILVRTTASLLVFERIPAAMWQQVAVLTGEPNDPRFGFSVLVGGPTTILVGATDAAFVFERTPGLGWQRVERLMVGARVGALLFSESTAVIGVPDANATYVFERDEGGPRAWGQVAQLTGSTSPEPDERFGQILSWSGDTLVVGTAFSAAGVGAYVFSRDRGGPNVWGQVAALPVRPGPSTVAIRGDTIFLVLIGFGGEIHIFERNRGGPNGWGEVASISTTNLGVSTTEDVLALGHIVFFEAQPGATLYARNQGGKSAWGEVARIGIPPLPGDGSRVNVLAIDHDTALVGGVASSLGGGPRAGSGPIGVYVADTDRDGVRDGIDPCPRDPLNRTEKHCRRDTSSLPSVDHLITSSEFATRLVRPRRAVITTTFTNSGAVAIRNPFFAVTEITEGAVLLNGDGLDRGVGATLSPDVGDGILSPGESTFVRFRVRLPRRGPLTFGVAVHGEEMP